MIGVSHSESSTPASPREDDLLTQIDLMVFHQTNTNYLDIADTLLNRECSIHISRVSRESTWQIYFRLVMNFQETRLGYSKAFLQVLRLCMYAVYPRRLGIDTLYREECMKPGLFESHSKSGMTIW